MAEPEICKQNGEGFILPFSETEWQTPEALRACLYGFALVYFFLGVSIVADTFMGAIECVTSRRKQRMLPTGRIVTIRTWNDTVANLSLMALGSSAPEILLAVTELLGGEMYSGELGPATIVGSASFNLLIIISLCIFIIPNTETRKIKEVPVFFITVGFMFIAYIWLVLIVAVISPDVVEIWEALVTLVLLPILILISYLADIGWFGEIGKHLEVREQDVDRVCELLGQFDRETKAAVKAGLAEQLPLLRKIEAPSAADMAEIRRVVKKHLVTKKSRAVRRVEATRALTGGKRLTTKVSGWNNPSRVSGVAGDCINGVPVALPKGHGPAIVQFSAEAQCMSEDLNEKPVAFSRCGDVSQAINVVYHVITPSSAPVEEGQKSLVRSSIAIGPVRTISSVNAARQTMCNTETGTVSFEAGEATTEAIVRRPQGVSADGSINQFTIEIMAVNSADSNEPCQVMVGAISTTRVVMRAAESSGRLSFAYERLLSQGTQDKVILQVMAQRMLGSSGQASCSFRTERLSAVPGYAYTETEGKLEFAPGQTEAFIDVEVLPKTSSTSQDEFLVVLEDAEGCEFDPNNDGGIESEILTIEITPMEIIQNVSGKMARWLDHRLNFDEVRLGTDEYKEQFISAIYCNGSWEDQQEASVSDWAFHILALPWKFIFMFVPPTTYCGGWVCFWLCLVFIGALTAIIGDMAELFGCVIGMPDLLTAISFVALGTSMPDLFASKSAATQDPTADASIINVTGSNSVNVFLGLGLPWTVGAIYWQVADWDSEWASKYPDIAKQKILDSDDTMAFVVRSGDLVFSVIIFSICAVLALLVLLVRRRIVGAELGGPFRLKVSSSVALAALWVAYVFLSGWWSIRQKQADTTEKLIMFIIGGCVMGLPVLVFLGIALQTDPLKEIAGDGDDSEEKTEQAPAKEDISAVVKGPTVALGDAVDKKKPTSVEVVPVTVKIVQEPEAAPREIASEAKRCAPVSAAPKTPPKDAADDLRDSAGPAQVKQERLEDPMMACEARLAPVEVAAHSHCCMTC